MFRKYTKIIEHFSFFGTKSCINNKKWPNAEKHLTIVYIQIIDVGETLNPALC
jgi:hypothetical protein